MNIAAGRRLIELLDKEDREVPVEVRVAALICSERRDWRLIIVTPLVDRKGSLFTNLVVFDAMQRDQLSELIPHIEIVGIKHPYLGMIHRLVGKTGKREIKELRVSNSQGFEPNASSSGPRDGVLEAVVYRSA